MYTLNIEKKTEKKKNTSVFLCGSVYTITKKI